MSVLLRETGRKTTFVKKSLSNDNLKTNQPLKHLSGSRNYKTKNKMDIVSLPNLYYFQPQVLIYLLLTQVYIDFQIMHLKYIVAIDIIVTGLSKVTNQEQTSVKRRFCYLKGNSSKFSNVYCIIRVIIQDCECIKCLPFNQVHLTI